MSNLQTLRYFMRYFEPHCHERDGKRYCYVSALEYPGPEDALEAFGGGGLFPHAPASIQLRYAELVGHHGEERWRLRDEQGPGCYPVWVAW
jgi:hypothetical protein